jgi:predicted nucleotidyltransferase
MKPNICRPSETLKIHKSEIEKLSIQLGLLEVKIFGSVARGEDTEKSDIDFLIIPNPNDVFSIYRFSTLAKNILHTKVNVLSNSPDELHFDSPIYINAIKEAVFI